MGYLFKQTYEGIDRDIKDKGWSWTYNSGETQIGKNLEFHREFLRDNGSIQCEVFDEELDKENEEWITMKRNYWTPKYPIKI